MIVCVLILCITIANVNQFVVAIDDRSTKTCNHREDIRFHQSHYIENKPLRDVIENYEAHHAHCYKLNGGNFTKDFVRGHKSMKCKYLVFNLDHSGLGNRVMGILSFYLLSLLTDRVLLVMSNEYDITDAFCQPFRNSDWFLPMHFHLPTHKHRFNSMDNMQQIFIYVHELTEDPHPAIYIDAFEQYLIPILYLNKNQDIQDKLNSWFPDKNVATVLMRSLLHPQNDVWDEILKSWLIKTRKANDITIGLQFRGSFIEPDKSTCLKNIPTKNVFAYIASLDGSAIRQLKIFYPKWTVYQRYADGREKHNIG